MQIGLAGATGFLGTPLVRALAADGHGLVLFTRRPQRRTGVREVEWHPDGTVGAWAGALDGLDAVINLAGESIAGRRWTPARKAALTESRLLVTRSLTTAIARTGRPPRTLVSGSAVGYYGPRGNELVTESDPAGDDFLARLAADWEHEAQAVEAVGTRVILLRTGLVLARDGGALAPMLLPFKLGLGGPMGTGDQFWPWIHRDDWIALVRFLLAHPSASGPVNATAPTPVTNATFAHTLARVLHRPALLRVPAFALRALMGEMADALIVKGQRVIPARALEMGFQFEYGELEPALLDVITRM